MDHCRRYSRGQGHGCRLPMHAAGCSQQPGLLFDVFWEGRRGIEGRLAWSIVPPLLVP